MGRANLIRVGFDNFTIFEIHFCTVSHDIKHVIETDIILTPFACMIENYTGVMVSYPGVNFDWARYVIDCEYRKGLKTLNLIFDSKNESRNYLIR